MPRSVKQKEKLLYLVQYLKDHSDENHAVKTRQLIDHLAANGISAERKSIYSDMETLTDFGFDIIKQPSGGYQLLSRDFELAEVKLLVDLVQSAKFLTQKKSRELIGKLERQVSRFDAAALQRQVVVADRNKAENEMIYYNVDVIYQAIAGNARIRFRYFEWDENKQKKLRRDGAYYEVSPWLMTWDDENYYLIAYDGNAAMMKHYRVDKMLSIGMTDRPREGKKEYEQIDIAAFSKKTFGMFAGEECTIRIRANKELMGVLIDRFGRAAAIRPDGDRHVIVRADVAVSPQFFGWLAGLGSRADILSPNEVRAQYRDYLSDILKNYDRNAQTGHT